MLVIVSSKCWKILCNSDFPPLLPVPNDILLKDDDLAIGLAVGVDWTL